MGQSDFKYRPLAKFRFNTDHASMPSHNALSGSHTEATPRELRGEEGIKYLRLGLRIHTHSRVGYFEDHAITAKEIRREIISFAEGSVENADANLHQAAIAFESLGSIDYQVHDELPYLRGVSVHER
jgi:hypothetical protein